MLIITKRNAPEEALDAREIEAMPGVSQVVRIRKDD